MEECYPQFKATSEANIYMQINVNGKIREMKYYAFNSEMPIAYTALEIL